MYGTARTARGRVRSPGPVRWPADPRRRPDAESREAPLPDPSPSYFVRVDEHRFLPTEHTGGGWAPDEQHISPMNGLLVHEVERFCAARPVADGLQVGRVSIDILGVLPIEEFAVEVQTLRPGRTIELVEATVITGGRAAVRARVWRMVAADTAAVAGGGAGRLPAPDTVPAWDLGRVWPGGFIGSVDFRPIDGPGRGRTTAWVRSDVPLLRAEPVSDLARFSGLVDVANGIAVREDPAAWLFPNLDLTIHLHEQPRGPWVGLDTTVAFGTGGLGLTSSVLHDEHGPVGTAAQTITVRPRG
jgi:hypothetical protein